MRWFHSGGIFAALSETTPELIIEGMKAAKTAGAIVSFDLNFRAKLWQIAGGANAPSPSCGASSSRWTCWWGTRRICKKALAFPGPEVAGKSKLDPGAFVAMIGEVVKLFPNIKIVATTLREVHSTHHHSWAAVAWINGKTFTSPTCELEVYDRVGGGDGFASGFFYGLLTGETPEESVKLGWAHGALLTTFPGDTTMATVDEVRAFAKGGSARIQR